MTSPNPMDDLPVRALIQGPPGAGKTGALACLVNAGYKLRVLAFDKLSNMISLYQYTKPEFRGNISILPFEDKTRMGQRFLEPVGIPEAHANALRAMDDWKLPDGTTLGCSRDWGLDTIVVLDSVTSHAESCMRRAMVMDNKNPLTRTWRTWGFAAMDQDQFVEKLVSNNNHFHFLALSHTKLIGPQDIDDKNDSAVTKEIKEQTAGLMAVRMYPTAVGRQLPQVFARHFPVNLLLETVVRQGKVKKVFHTAPRPEMDLKVPAPDLPAELDLSDGLLRVFKALGKVPPGEVTRKDANV